MNRDDAEAAIAELLLEQVRADRYPSVTQMTMLEQILPPDMLGEYVDVLLDKVAGDRWPSIPMLRRIQRLSARLPRDDDGDVRRG